MPKIALFYGSAGEGHRKIAEAIRDALIETGGDGYSVTCMDSLELTRDSFRKSYKGIYHFLATRLPMVWGLFYYLTDLSLVYFLLRPFRRWTNAWHAGPLRSWLMAEKPDVVVNTHFLSAEVAGALKMKGQLNARLLTVITDYGAHRLWVNPGTDHYAVMHEVTLRDVVARGGDRSITRVTGIPIHTEFLKTVNRKAVLSEYGLDPNKKTVMITSGSFGLGPTEDIIRALDGFSSALQIIVVAGRNEQLKKSLETFPHRIHVVVFGFIDFMPKLMAVSDLAIVKPGGSTATECLAIGLPFVVFSYIPGQESRNVALLKKMGAVRMLKRPRDIGAVLDDVLHNPDEMTAWKGRMQLLARPDAVSTVTGWICDLGKVKDE